MKLEASGLITSHSDKEGARPEKTVYQISEDGSDKFKEQLKQTLRIKYRPTFDAPAYANAEKWGYYIVNFRTSIDISLLKNYNTSTALLY